MRRTLASNHNRRVAVLLLLLFVILFTGLRLIHSPRIVFGIAFAFEIPGIIYVVRLGRRQSVALGYSCPRCGATLYDGASNRLAKSGECPSCKQFIMDDLNKKFA